MIPVSHPTPAIPSAPPARRALFAGSPLARLALCASLLALLAPWSGAAHAAALSPEAKAVLDRYVAASGGRAAIDGATSQHVKGTVRAFGFSGTLETWSVAPDHSASVTKLGPFVLQEGFDGTTGWHTDPSGKLQMLDGKDLERAKADAWFDNERFLAPDQGGGTVTFVGSITDSIGAHVDLDIAPPAGAVRRFAFDKTTGLPVRTVTKHDQQTVVSFYSDYRAVQGRHVPFQTTTSIADMPANTISLATDSVWFNEPILATRFAAPHVEGGDLTYLKQPGIARLPMAYRGRHVWLRASVNGGPMADFLFDTGASISVIDSAYAAKIGLVTEGNMQATGAGSAGGATFSHLKTLRVAGDDGDGVELRDQKVAVLSVNPFLAPFFWRDCAGVLGYNFISQFVDEIDYDGRVLTLYDPKTFEYHGKGSKIPITLAGTVPVVKMTVDGKYEGDFRLDVGSNSTVDLHGPFVKKNGLDPGAGHGIVVTGGGFGGTFSSRLVRLKSLAIGSYSWQKPMLSLSGATSGALASEDYAGNVGNALMERFKVTLDYDRHVLYLEPGAKYAEPDHFSRAGVQFAKYGGDVTAMQVLDGSPAAKSGIQEGDVLVSLNGKPAAEYDPDGIADLLEHAAVGTKVTAVISHDGKSKTCVIVLKDLL